MFSHPHSSRLRFHNAVIVHRNGKGLLLPSQAQQLLRNPLLQTNEHLVKCITYVDLSMVRTGVAKHPQEWIHSGYNEIQRPRQRYGIIDFKNLHLNVKSQKKRIRRYRRYLYEAGAVNRPKKGKTPEK